MQHAILHGGSWSITEVDQGVFDFWLDAAVASDGTVHAVYLPRPRSDTVFRYAVDDGSGWVKETVSGCISDLSMALDPQGRPHVACFGPQGLHYHVRDGGTWSSSVAVEGSELVPPRPTTHVGLEPSIVVDDQGQPHVSFRTRSDFFVPNHLYYAGLAHGAWHAELLDVAGWSTGWGSAISLDPAGRPAIASVLAWTTPPAVPCGTDGNSCFDLRFSRPATGYALSPLP